MAAAATNFLQKRLKDSNSSFQSSELITVGWNPETLIAVRDLLGSKSVPAWAAAAKQALSKQAKKVVSLPAGLRPGVSAGPWSVTAQGPKPATGTNRDYMTVSGYYWPCNVSCPISLFGAEKCQSAWHAPTTCNGSSGLPWSKHDGFLNQNNLDDLNAMIVMMDTVETLTLAWWFLPEHDLQYAETATRVLRVWFFNESTGMLPRLLFGGGIPGVYEGTAGAIIAPSFRLNTRLSDCVQLLKEAGTTVWTDQDTASWKEWSKSWLNWLHTSEFGQIELGAVGNHATFLFAHKLALARGTGNLSIIQEVVSHLRTDYAGSLAEQITPSGEMPTETNRVTGSTYSQMNLKGLFLLGVAVQNACRDLNCSPAWDWSWEVSQELKGNWQTYNDQISYCKYKGSGSTESVDACKASCLNISECNGVVTRHVSGNLRGCYFKLCKGIIYQHKESSPGGSVYTSYHYVKGAPVGSGSVRKALDFIRPYALGLKSWSADFPKAIDGEDTWRDMALPLRIASSKYNNETYEADIKRVDPENFFSQFTHYGLLYPPGGALDQKASRR